MNNIIENPENSISEKSQDQTLSIVYRFSNITEQQRKIVQKELGSYQTAAQSASIGLKPLIEFGFDRDDRNILRLKTDRPKRNLDSTIIQGNNAFDDIKSTLSLMKKITHALKQLHSLGFLHSNLSLKNIEMNNGKICLGLPYFNTIKRYQKKYKNLGDKPLQTDLLLAPELAKGFTQSEKSDVWLLGIVFLQIFLSKRQTFRNDEDLAEAKSALWNKSTHKMFFVMLDVNHQFRCSLGPVQYMLNIEQHKLQITPAIRFASTQIRNRFIASKPIQKQAIISMQQRMSSLCVQQLKNQFLKLLGPKVYSFELAADHNGFFPMQNQQLVVITLYRQNQSSLQLLTNADKDFICLKANFIVAESKLTFFISQNQIPQQLSDKYLKNISLIQRLFRLKEARLTLEQSGTIRLEIYEMCQSRQSYNELAIQFTNYRTMLKQKCQCLMRRVLINTEDKVFLQIGQSITLQIKQDPGQKQQFHIAHFTSKTPRDRYVSLAYNYSQNQTQEKIKHHSTNLLYWYIFNEKHFFQNYQIKFNSQELTFELDEDYKLDLGSPLSIVFSNGHIYTIGILASATTGLLFGPSIINLAYPAIQQKAEPPNQYSNYARIRNWSKVDLSGFEAPYYKPKKIVWMKRYLGIFEQIEVNQMQALEKMVRQLTDDQFLSDCLSQEKHRQIEAHLQTSIKYYGENNSFILRLLWRLFLKLNKSQQHFSRSFQIYQKMLAMLFDKRSELDLYFINEVIIGSLQLFPQCQFGNKTEVYYLQLLLILAKAETQSQSKIYLQEASGLVVQRMIDLQTQRTHPSLPAMVHDLELLGQIKKQSSKRQSAFLLNWQKIYQIVIEREVQDLAALEDFLKLTQDYLRQTQGYCDFGSIFLTKIKNKLLNNGRM